jgi:fatty-acyl-CoA synthase
MGLTSSDKICIPPPLFHCFGLVLGNLAVFTHGATAVYASETFNPAAVLKVISQEKCTGLHGVPTMFVAELDHEDFHKYDYSTLRYLLVRSNFRTGIAAGSSVPAKLMERIHKKLNLTGLTICYGVVYLWRINVGMTETSPVSYQTTLHSPLQKRIETVGTILPHTQAKIVKPGTDEILPIGQRGELCVSGYLLQKGI